MLKTKKYNYSNQILDYGFEELEVKQSNLALAYVVSTVKENIIIVDTVDSFFTEALTDFEHLLNQSAKLVIGLVSEPTLKSLKDKGVKSGFIRSAKSDFKVGLIIVDKSMVYAVLDKNHVYQIISPDAVKEIFDYVNHVIWSKSSFELFQGELKTVKETRQSVVVPAFDNSSKRLEGAFFATKGADVNCKLPWLKKEEISQPGASVIAFNVEAFVKTYPSVYINIFGDQYYGFAVSKESFVKAEAFANKPLGDYEGKKIWLNGEIQTVLGEDKLRIGASVPLNVVNTFEPNYDELVGRYKGLATNLIVEVDVKPKKLDDSYSLSSRYSVIAKASKDIEEGLKKVENLDPEKSILKKIASIREERNIIEKIKMFNVLAKEKSFGDDVLKNKKSPISIINVNEEDLVVPNELIGKLYTKEKKMYLATSEKYLKEAIAWLKENKQEAVLIEA